VCVSGDADDGLLRLEPVLLGGEPVIRVGGELDCSNAGEFVLGVGDLCKGSTLPVVLDITDLSFCDAAGLGALRRLERCVAPLPLVLRSPQPFIRHVFEVTGFDRLVG
jgi:anti-sigma B factor antagonist